MNSVDYMVNGIKETCRRFKGRSAGSEAERRCQDYFAEELGKVADDVKVQPFSLHPQAFFGWLPIAGGMEIASVMLVLATLLTQSHVCAIAAAALNVAAFAMLLFEFVLYRKPIDFLYPQKESKNVLAIRSAKKKARRRIVFVGHADAAYELTFLEKHGGSLLAPTVITAIAGMVLLLILNMTLMFRCLGGHPCLFQGFWLFAFIFEVCLVPVFSSVLIFINGRIVTDGANDNLSACYVAMALLREMAASDMRFEHTEVGCLITGGEESGLRGSLAFAQDCKEWAEEIETVFVALDTLREVEQLQVYLRGINWTQGNDRAVGNLLKQAGTMAGLTMNEAKIYPGATDAEAFSRYGMRACGLCGVDHNLKTYYHTREDNADNISPDCLKKSLELCRYAVQLYDRSDGIDDYKG